MIIETDYGTVEYEEENLITFTDGLFGFPALKRYLFLTLDESDDSMLLMQSVDDPNVGFALINPYILCPDYSPKLTPEELSCLSVTDEGDLSYYSICVVHSDYLENTVNLKCPLVINPDTREGIQVILENSAYGYRQKLRSFPSVTDSTNTEDGSDNHANTST
ncbi:MAG: flagellar assembly protein FliW [Lachnospiraceae bacterium]|nr:flagellar assembly protein FliW [Lachnospiraceae bacterium]